MVLRDQADALGDGVAREEAVLRLIDLLRGPLSRFGEVLEAVRMLLNDQTSDETLEELVSRLDDANIAPRIGPPLADFFAEREQPEREANIWEWLLENFEDETEADKARRRLVALYGDALDSAEGVVLNAVMLLAVDPYDAGIGGALDQALSKDPLQLSHADEVMEEQIAIASLEHQVVCRGILATAATAHGDLEKAEAIYRRILGDQPRDLDTVVALEDVLQTGEKWSSFAEVLEQHIDLVHESPEAEIDVRMRLASVRRFGLQDLHGAEDSLRQVLLQDPRHQEAFADLCDILEQRHDKAAKADLYQQRVLVAETSERVFLRIELLPLLSEALGDAVGAQEHALALLEEAGTDTKTRGFVLALYRNTPDTRVALHAPLYAALSADGRYQEADETLSTAAEFCSS